MKHTKSEQLFKEAEKYIPGGVNSPVRAFKSVGLAPIFADKAHGDRLIDVDGNEYIDYICSWGPLMLGHSPDFMSITIFNWNYIIKFIFYLFCFFNISVSYINIFYIFFF